MQKYTLTTVADLQPGDKFIKHGDVNDIVYTILSLPCSLSGKRYVQKGNLKFTDIVSTKEQVIFFKHK